MIISFENELLPPPVVFPQINNNNNNDEFLTTGLNEENNDFNDGKPVANNTKPMSLEGDSKSTELALGDPNLILEGHDSYSLSDEEDMLFNSRSKEKVIHSSEDENSIPDFSQASKVDIESEKVRRRIIAHDSDSNDHDDDEVKEEDKPKTRIQYKSDIFDSEITDEADNKYQDLPCVGSAESDHSEEVASKKQGKQRPKKISLTESKQQMREIRSTAQRMIRESEISLPYHRPKQHTLMEFLNRKKPIIAFDKTRSLKMSMKDINHLREIEERKKEVDTFFRSDSEEETEVGETTANDSANETVVKDIANETVVKDTANETVARYTDSEITPMNEEEDFTPPDLEVKRPDHLSEISSTIKDSINIATDFKEGLDSTSGDGVVGLPPDAIPGMKWTESGSEKNEERVSENVLKAAFPKDNFWLASNDASNHKIDLDDDDYDDFKLHLDTEELSETMGGSTKFEDSAIKTKINQDKVNISEPLNSVNKSQRLSLLASKFPHLNIGKLTDTSPRLSLGEGNFVYLDEDNIRSTPIRQQGLADLLHRFVKHSNTKRKPADAQQVMLGVVSKELSAEGEEKLVHSNICVSVDGEKDIKPKDETPGACLVRLKKTLGAQLLERRERERQRRVKEKQFLDSEKVIQDYHEDGLPDEELELTDQSETDAETEESEPEENDVILTDKKRKRNKYLDDEADVDDDENGDEQSEEGNEPDFADDNDNDEREDDENRADASSEDEDSLQSLPAALKRKALNRISDDEEDSISVTHVEKDSWTIKYQDTTDSTADEDRLKLCLEDIGSQDLEEAPSVHTLSRTNTTEDLFPSETDGSVSNSSMKVASTLESVDSSFDWQSSYLPGFQPGGGRDDRPKQGESSLDESLNTSSLTLFSKLEYERRECVTEDTVDDGRHRSALNFLLTPLKESQTTPPGNTQSIKRSLLLDIPTSKGQVKERATSDELFSLCSGKFTATDNSESFYGLDINADLASQDLDEAIGLCSGKFGTQMHTGDRNPPLTQPNREEPGSDGEDNFFPMKSYRITSSAATNSTSERTGHSEGFEKERERVVSSSDEEEIILRQENQLKMRRKKRRRIVALSDDDGAADDSWVSVSKEEEEEQEHGEEVEYNENEEPIIRAKFTGFKDSVKGGIRADFLEKEAELSGSEEGSDDEEEPDEEDDYMEREDGDAERFDEEELRNQVGRVHMKSLIDSDKRELRLLQEMYLEDGDLHGEGRQRKFRWKNIDKREEGDQQSDEEEEESKEDMEEEEEEWRRQRIEREKFLHEQEKKRKENRSPLNVQDRTVSSLDTTCTMKLIQNRKSTVPLKFSNHTHSQDSLLFLNTATKKGSFLSRDQSTLKRLAEFTKENHSVGVARPGGHFVFQTLTEEEVEERSRVPKKRTNGDAGNPPGKKSRIERSFFSMEESVQSTSIFKHL